MSFISRNLKETCTFWGATPDGYDGYTFSAPVHIKCRWEEKGEIFMNAQGEQEVSNAVVYVAEDVSMGGFLYRGESDEVNPTTVAGTYRIKRFNKITSLRALDVNRIAYL